MLTFERMQQEADATGLVFVIVGAICFIIGYWVRDWQQREAQEYEDAVRAAFDGEASTENKSDTLVVEDTVAWLRSIRRKPNQSNESRDYRDYGDEHNPNHKPKGATR